MTGTKSASRAIRRWLPVSVVGLGVIAGLLLAAYLVTRPSQPIGQADPTPTPAVSATETVPSPSAGAGPSEGADASATPVPETPIPSGPARIGWTGGDRRPGDVRAVTRHGGQWIAGGMLFDGTVHRAAVWVSDDGSAWSDAIFIGPDPVQEEGFWHRHWINGFGTWDGDLLALGWNGVGCCDGGYPMMWRSADGETWQVVDLGGTAFGDTSHFPQFGVPVPDGGLAVLSVTGLGSGAAVFLTGDLAAWETHPITDPTELTAVSGLAASPTRLLAVGTETVPSLVGEEPTTVAHAWISTDAMTWTALVPPSEADALSDVAWDGVHGRFVVIGDDEAGLPHAWLTTDGARWSSISLGTEPARMQRITATDGLIIATGTTGTPGDTSGETIAWSSRDGVTWWYGPVLDGQAPTAVGAHADSAVLLASQWTDADGERWVALSGSVVPID